MLPFPHVLHCSFSHPSFTHFTSCFGKPPLQGVPVSGDQKQDSGEEPNFSLAAFRPATAKQVCCSTKKCEFSVPEMEPKNVCIFDPYERPPLLILDFTIGFLHKFVFPHTMVPFLAKTCCYSFLALNAAAPLQTQLLVLSSAPTC